MALPSGSAGGARRDTPITCASSSGGCAATGPRSCSTTDGGLRPELRELAPRGRAADGRQPTRQRRPAPARAAHAGLPRLRRSRRASRDDQTAEATRRHGRVAARRDAPQRRPAQLPRLRTRRDRLQPALGDLRGDGPDLDGASSCPDDDHLSPDGRVMEILSEHTCQGWLEGYLLTGRHGLFNTYEAFVHIVDSMFNQHAKWLKSTAQEIPWRAPIASLNYLLSSHVWRQDHNGFSHQDPGFIDHVVNKKAERHPRLPPARREHAPVGDRPLPAQPQLRQRDRRGQAARAAVPRHGRRDQAHTAPASGSGSGRATTRAAEPDVVMACCGDIPTLETLAAVDFLRRRLPDLRIRVVNVVDLMVLQPEEEHPHGLTDRQFDTIFTDRPADHLRLPRIPVADPPADLPAHQPRQPPRARLQGGGDHDDAVRHGRAQRPGPLPPGDRRDRPDPRPRRPRRVRRPRRPGTS